MFRLNIWEGSCAMRCSPWELDPDFSKLDEPLVSVVLKTVVYQPGRHMCLTTINHQQFFTDCVLQKGIESHVILNGVLQYSEGKWWIKAGPDTRTFPRQVAEMKGLYNVIDACSGIGAVTQGFTACGAQIVCHIESNQAFHQWQETRSQSTCIRGCVNDPNTVYEVSKHVQESHVLTAGIS